MLHHKDLDLMIGFYGTDYLGLAENLEEGLARGDFNTFWLRFLARRLMRKARKEHWLSNSNTPQGLVQRQTHAAEKSARAALAAVGVSIFALVISVLAYLKPPESPELNKPTSSTQMLPSVGQFPQKSASAVAR